jgi:hypothetical protein
MATRDHTGRFTAADPKEGDRYICRWPSGFIFSGQTLDAGQVFRLTLGPNTRDLIRLRYIEGLTEKDPRLATCGVCGGEFVDDVSRDGHGRKRHARQDESPSGVPAGAGLAMEDRSSAAEDRLNEAALRGELG